MENVANMLLSVNSNLALTGKPNADSQSAPVIYGPIHNRWPDSKPVDRLQSRLTGFEAGQTNQRLENVN